MTFYERIENQGTQTLAVWMFIELLARMCNVLRLGSEVCNWLPASYLKKKEYSLHSAFCTQPAFYSQSAVCILHSLCILPWSAFCSLQSAVCSLQSAVCVLHWPYENLLKEKREINSRIHTDGLGIKPKKSVRRKKRTLRWNVHRTIIYRLYINYLTFWPQNCSNVCFFSFIFDGLTICHPSPTTRYPSPTRYPPPATRHPSPAEKSGRPPLVILFTNWNQHVFMGKCSLAKTNVTCYWKCYCCNHKLITK